jgi:hypothetical protein
MAEAGQVGNRSPDPILALKLLKPVLFPNLNRKTGILAVCLFA